MKKVILTSIIALIATVGGQQQGIRVEEDPFEVFENEAVPF